MHIKYPFALLKKLFRIIYNTYVQRYGIFFFKKETICILVYFIFDKDKRLNQF